MLAKLDVFMYSYSICHFFYEILKLQLMFEFAFQSSWYVLSILRGSLMHVGCFNSFSRLDSISAVDASYKKFFSLEFFAYVSVIV